MTDAEAAHYTAVYAAVLGSDPQRDHDNAEAHAKEALDRFRKAMGK